MIQNKKVKSIILSIPIFLFVGIYIYMIANGISYLDNSILKYVSENISHSTVELMKILTNLCSIVIFMLIILLIALNAKNAKIGIVFTNNILFCYILNTVIKFLVLRPRPIYMLVEESGYSFPSAHSMLSISFYGFLIYLIMVFIKNKPCKIVLIMLCIAATLIVGLTRICLCVHYPTDVLGGFLFGYIYLMIFIKYSKDYMLKS